MGAEKTIDDPLNLSPEAASTILSGIRGANVVQGTALRLAQEALQQMVADTGRYSTSEALTALNEMVADILDGYIDVQSIEIRHRIIENALSGDRARRRTSHVQTDTDTVKRVAGAFANQFKEYCWTLDWDDVSQERLLVYNQDTGKPRSISLDYLAHIAIAAINDRLTQSPNGSET